MLAQELKPGRHVIELRAQGWLRTGARCQQAPDEQGKQREGAARAENSWRSPY
jgi:hypothetical protein